MNSIDIALLVGQPFRQDRGLLCVVPRPCPCQEPARPLSPSLFGVPVQLSTDRES